MSNKVTALTPKSELPWEPQDAWVRLIVYYGLILALMITFQLAFGQLIITFLYADNPQASIILIANTQAAIIGIVGIAMTYVFLKYDDKNFKMIGIEDRNNKRNLLLAALIITPIALIVAYIIEVLGAVVFVDQMLNDRFKIESGEALDFFIRVIIVFAGIAIGEEVIFRGYILNLLDSQMSFKSATLFSSILFGLLHSFILTSASKQALQSMIAVGVSASIFGVVFAYAYLVSGKNIIFPVLIHGIWNSIIFFFNTDYDYETVEQILIEIFSQLVAAVIIMGLLYVAKEYLKKD